MLTELLNKLANTELWVVYTFIGILLLALGFTGEFKLLDLELIEGMGYPAIAVGVVSLGGAAFLKTAKEDKDEED